MIKAKVRKELVNHMEQRHRRFFLIVMDSLGIGAMEDADRFGDAGANTFVHISEVKNGLNIPTLASLGIKDLADIKGVEKFIHPQSYSLRLHEMSNGKDTMTGHWEMMGIYTTKPFKTFTDTGFPQALIDELERETGHKIIGNKAASGTQIIEELGEEQIRDNSLIVYTSADSVLQIAASEEVTGLDELYRCCEIARKICLRPEYLVGRVIARPYVGRKPGEFKRTSNRHDLALAPSEKTVMDILKENHYDVSCVGKIYDIFDGQGATTTVKTTSNEDGMDKTIAIAKGDEFKEGLCFVNLVEFDSEYGHRRNPIGYGNCIEAFDIRLKQLMDVLKEDDVLMVTADHGNDPTWHGTDHTREMVPLLIYSKSFEKGRHLSDRKSFADIGQTILKNFGLPSTKTLIGSPIEEILEE